MSTRAMPAGNVRVGLMALGLALAMLALGFAAVPLYRIFCQVTGFGGTTMRVSEAQAAQVQSAGKPIVVRFDGNVDPALPWKFYPEQVKQTVTIGERQLAVFIARNDSDRPITGQASFNVTPDRVGKYFNKVQCFCFTEQTLQPGEEVRMPVIYYVDPALLDNESARDVAEITLSYTFYELKDVQDKQG